MFKMMDGETIRSEGPRGASLSDGLRDTMGGER